MGWLLVAEPELFFARKPSQQTVVQLKSEADELCPHRQRVHAAMKALMPVYIAHYNQLAKLMVRNAIEPHPRSAQLWETRKQKGSKIDSISKRLKRGMAPADFARQIDIPWIWISSHAIALGRTIFDQKPLEAERRPGESTETEFCFEFANEAADAAELLRQP